MCYIITDPWKKEHRIHVVEGVMGDIEWYLSDLVHELCHAALAERVDPVFSTGYFSTASRELDRQNPQEFARRYHLFKWTRRHEDIWVNDLRHQHWPELTQQDCETVIGSARRLVKAGQAGKLHDLGLLYGLALQLAEIHRHGLTRVDIEAVFQEIGEKATQVVTTIQHFCESLPRLTYKREEDVKIYEKFVLEAVSLLQLPITPRLVQEDGIYVWEI